jgi:putative transposase
VIEQTIAELVPAVGVAAACRAAGRPRATHYRHHRHSQPPPRPAPSAPRPQPRALSLGERQQVLDVLHSERFCDQAPAEVYATLLDEGAYLASISTMYRLLHAQGEVGERRRQATHPATVKPELVADAPNRVWSWDITKLLGPATWTYFYLYTILDIYSRYAVGWMVAHHESAALAERLIAETLAKQGIGRDQLAIHADRGTSMASKLVAQLLADLGVTKSHSRPHVPDDNPFSESQFKTLKYCPAFPERFGSIQHARSFCEAFFLHYNHEHRHSGIAYHTPASVHYGTAAQVRAQRQVTLDAAYAANPDRFHHRRPRPPKLPAVAWINEPSAEIAQTT